MLDEFYLKKKYNKLSLLIVYVLRLYQLLQIPRKAKIVIEKELFPFIPFWFEKYLLKKHIVILDYDDAIFTFYEQHKLFIIRKLYEKKIDQLMVLSDTVICGSHFLFERAEKSRSKNVKLIPTVVDISRYKVQNDKSSDLPIIVWIGTPSTIHFIELIKPVLQELSEKYLFKFRVIGCLKFNIPGVNVECFEWSLDNEIKLISEADIGVMPLYDTDWEKGKCGYKLIQYMASGLPVVASAVGENNYIVQSSCGYIAKSQANWIEFLSILLEQEHLRESMGNIGRIHAERYYSQEAVRDFWLKVVLNQ
jgi:glycosyltransferase involved in cell wall biosynthesis